MQSSLDTVMETDPNAKTIASGGGGGGEASLVLQRGAQLGRYLVLERIGAGGMGVVYAAFDPQLDRKIALKLVRSEAGAGGERLQREAQAMARLSHPNVITVHDVGLVDGRLFIAMEFVDGQTLGEWLGQAAGRSWEQIVDVFARAGAGLAAAHAKDLVHRDFKPDNVLIGHDGRVRVMDFGLARESADEAEAEAKLPGDAPADALAGPAVESAESVESAETAEPASQRADGISLSQTLTAAGAIMGTPAYMAPEQHLGRRADHRADQYSFCVALYEGLYGVRPFVGDNYASLALAVIAGELPPAPKSSVVPAWLHALLARGLASAPEARFSSMGELLEALARGQRGGAKWRRVGLAAGLGAAILTLGLALGQKEAVRGPCDGVAAQLDETWGSARRAELGAVLQQVGFGGGAQASVLGGIDDYVREQGEARVQNCRATKVEATQSGELMDLRAACLGRRQLELDELVKLLASGNTQALAEASANIEGLTPVSVCSDAARLRARVPIPEDPQVRAAVTADQQRLARVGALLDAGLYAQALADLDGLEQDGPGRSYAPHAAEIGHLRGRVLQARGDYVGAEAAYEAALEQAGRGRDDRRFAALTIALMQLVGEELGRSEEAQRLSLVARSLLAGSDTGADLELERRVIMAQVTRIAGAPDESLAQLDALREELRDDTPLALRVDRMRAGLLANNGQLAQAQAMLEQTIERLEARLGPEHPQLLSALGKLASTQARSGDLARSRELNARALKIAERWLGETHPRTGVIHESAGLGWYHGGDFARARTQLELAVSTYALHYDGAHPSLVRARGNLAAVLMELEELEAAEQVLVTCRDELMARYGPRHDYLVFVLANLSEIYAEQGRTQLALASIREGREIAVAQLGADTPRVALSWFHEGRILLREGDLTGAERAFEVTLEMMTRLEMPVPPLGFAQASLALVRLKLKQPRAENLELLASAKRRVEQAGEAGAATLEDIAGLEEEFGI